jgi:hypothetical protein
MNSDTHSCTHSLASLLTFAEPGKAFFMIRATFAIYTHKYLVFPKPTPIPFSTDGKDDVQVKTYPVLYTPRPALL